MRRRGVGTRPNGPICLTTPERVRDGERAAQSESTRGHAADAVRTLRPAGLTGGAMVQRAYTARNPGERLLPAGHERWDPTLREVDGRLDDEGQVVRLPQALAP